MSPHACSQWNRERERNILLLAGDNDKRGLKVIFFLLFIEKLIGWAVLIIWYWHIRLTTYPEKSSFPSCHPNALKICDSHPAAKIYQRVSFSLGIIRVVSLLCRAVSLGRVSAIVVICHLAGGTELRVHEAATMEWIEKEKYNGAKGIFFHCRKTIIF